MQCLRFYTTRTESSTTCSTCILSHSVIASVVCVVLQVMPMVKAVSRGYTTCADAYLTPVLMQYLASFSSGFDSGFNDVQTLFMQR
jgi:N-methylhydantoinase A/oxoprolinase/acetone carboxylase beta subunit